MDLTREDVERSVAGKRVSIEAMQKCAWPRSAASRYSIQSAHFLYEPDLLAAFKITEKLKDRWQRRGTEFNVYVNVSDGVIESVSISKNSENDRGVNYNLSVDPQELRVAKRILDYITE